MKKTKKIISIILLLLVSLTTNILCIYAQEQAEIKDLSVQEAAALAIENSSELKKLNETMKLNSASRQEKLDDMKIAIPDEDDEILYNNNSDVSAILEVISLDLTNATNKIEKEVQEEKIKQSIRNIFLTINNSKSELLLAEQAREIAAKKLEISEKRVQLGLKTQLEYSTEKLDYENELKKQEKTKLAIENNYISLNILMGKPIDTRYNLILDIEYKPLEEINLDDYIRGKKLSDPNITKKQNEVQKAKYQLNIISTSGSNSYETRYTNYIQAVRAVEDEKIALDEKIRKSYNDIKTLELSIAENELQLKKLKSNLAILEVQLELGRVTELTVNDSKYEIVAKERAIEIQKLEYAISTYKFEKPYLL